MRGLLKLINLACLPLSGATPPTQKGKPMEVFKADVVIIGAGGAGLRAAIAVAEADPALTIALVSKVYPMRSHTVAAEGGAAAVTLPHDNLDYHFNDTVGGGDWPCHQDVVE